MVKFCQKRDMEGAQERWATSFLGETGRNGVQFENMQLWGLIEAHPAGKYLYHEETFMPDPILKSKTHQVFGNDMCPMCSASEFFNKLPYNIEALIHTNV